MIVYYTEIRADESNFATHQTFNDAERHIDALGGNGVIQTLAVSPNLPRLQPAYVDNICAYHRRKDGVSKPINIF